MYDVLDHSTPVEFRLNPSSYWEEENIYLISYLLEVLNVRVLTKYGATRAIEFFYQNVDDLERNLRVLVFRYPQGINNEKREYLCLMETT